MIQWSCSLAKSSRTMRRTVVARKRTSSRVLPFIVACDQIAPNRQRQVNWSNQLSSQG